MINNYNIHDLKIFLKLATTNNDSLILRGNRIFIPRSLQNRMITLAHENHLGICKTKTLLRDKVYFPAMDSKIEKILSKCISCTATSRSDPLPPLEPTQLPPAAWQTLNIDFLGPFPNQQYLLVIPRTDVANGRVFCCIKKELINILTYTLSLSKLI